MTAHAVLVGDTMLIQAKDAASRGLRVLCIAWREMNRLLLLVQGIHYGLKISLKYFYQKKVTIIRKQRKC